MQMSSLLIAGIASLAFSVNAISSTDLGTAPLVSATTGDVLPNLMYILDNSGSMSWDYMPDYVNDSNKCKATSGTFSNTCAFGHPPYNSSEFNSIYYNPAITYTPRLDGLGAQKPSMTSAYTSGWTQVDVDAYGIQKTDQLGNTISSNKISLVPNIARTVGYPDRVWCNSTGTKTVTQMMDTTQCKQNSQYIYPSSTFSNGTNMLLGHPYYYTVAAGEYCTDKNLTSCIVSTVPVGANTFPAKLRWCNSAAAVISGVGCQAKYNETTSHTFARWSGINPGTASTGKIKINADPNGASPSLLSVSSITVNGVSIIAATPALTIIDTTNTTQRNNLASSIATAIMNLTGDDFTASASGDEVTIMSGTSPFTGTIALTATSGPAATIPGTKAAGSITFTRARNSATMNSITLTTSAGPVLIMNSTLTTTTSGTDNLPDFATKVKNAINALTATSGYSASCSGGATCTNGTVNIAAANTGTQFNGPISTYNEGASQGASDGSGSIRYNTSALAGGTNQINAGTFTIPTTITQFTGGTPSVNSFSRVDIVPTTLSYSKAASRTDCAGTTCTYDEEMTNFANWYSYYRTRMQMMKTSTSHAFKTIDSRFRVGFITINNPSSGVNYLPIARFDGTQKNSWYDSLVAAVPGSSTPLRAALSTTGRIFAGKTPVGSSDPVQYSCQQNFALLTTDGYWNTGNGVEINGSTTMGNYDGGTTPRPMYEGPTATSNTLADVAKYYYDTDLRTSALGNCTGSTRPNGTTGDVCDNNVFVTSTDNNNKQHMTTFTLGLGVDATLTYTSDYKTADEGDFYEIKQGTRNWPVPAADTQTAVDDLWHAAVNGQGTYFSAKDPRQLASSLSEALSSIKAKTGAGAAAATSTLNPVSGDNFTYVASYTSVKWIGNLEARTVNTNTGKVSEDATWCLENVVADTCAAPSSIVTIPGSAANGYSTTYQCVTPGATTATCGAPSILDGTDCKTEIATSCTGTLQSLVSDATDTRTIFMNVNGALGSFNSSNLSVVGKNANFENAFLATKLSQWSSLTTAQRALANSTSLVSYLRGNTGFEDRASNAPPSTATDNRLYRFREATLGDLVDSTPVYVGAPKANFSDPGYGTATTLGSFKATHATRAGTVYIGANDGMLHAINAVDGMERWAYVPTMVLDNMWKLADTNYNISHSYYVNGDIVVNDVCTAGCTSASTAVWKTILVAGLNGGGKGYFALDITNPNSPVLLWEFDATDDSDIGYSYGNPIVTKKADGTWVVLITSGYNNTTGSNPGKGFLYVLNASTGAIISKYGTGVGDSTTPSGLAKINTYVPDAIINNTAEFVYGGDLLGNLWRFDINSSQSATNPFKVAVLKDPSGNTQPITVRPELAEVNGKRVVYVGTGRYLGTSDLTDTQQQTIYAISDDASGTPTTLDNPRSSSLMVKQVLVNDTGTSTRSIQQPANSVSFTTGRGWYIDFPDSGERQNVPAQLVFGTLLLPTTVPSNTVCSPGGYGWLNFLDYKTGASVAGNVVASKTNAPIININVLYVKGKPVVNIVTADNPTPTFPPEQPKFTGGSESGFTNHRVIWRELTGEDFEQ